MNLRHIFNEGPTEVVISHLLSFVETKEETFFFLLWHLLHAQCSLSFSLSLCLTHSLFLFHSLTLDFNMVMIRDEVEKGGRDQGSHIYCRGNGGGAESLTC